VEHSVFGPLVGAQLKPDRGVVLFDDILDTRPQRFERISIGQAIHQPGLGKRRYVRRVSALHLHEDQGLEFLRSFVLDVDSGSRFEGLHRFIEAHLFLIYEGAEDFDHICVRRWRLASAGECETGDEQKTKPNY
jgi:hypothetical protein